MNLKSEIFQADSTDSGSDLKRKEIEFHYAEEPDQLLSPKLGLELLQVSSNWGF